MIILRAFHMSRAALWTCGYWMLFRRFLAILSCFHLLYAFKSRPLKNGLKIFFLLISNHIQCPSLFEGIALFMKEVSAEVNNKPQLSVFDNLLFERFASSVVSELESIRSVDDSQNIALRTKNQLSFENLIFDINQLTFQYKPSKVNEISKSILVRLFPQWLLPSYKILFGPFASFSAWMNAWVTHWTTYWLMGSSTG